MSNIDWAIKELVLLNPNNKFETMLKSAAIITKLLESYHIKPIIVGGFSVEIYTNRDYSTRDIDFIAQRLDDISAVLKDIGFKKEGSHFSHDRLQIAIEFPDDSLAGSHEKIVRLDIGEDLYVYVISIEDIIMDRLRASLYWKESESKEWGMKLLANYYDELDIQYMKTVGAESKIEIEEIQQWISELIELGVIQTK